MERLLEAIGTYRVHEVAHLERHGSSECFVHLAPLTDDGTSPPLSPIRWLRGPVPKPGSTIQLLVSQL